MTSFFRKLRWLIHRPSKEAELEDELQFHLHEEADERQAQGLTSEEARWGARRELGNLALVQEYTRAAWTLECQQARCDGRVRNLRISGSARRRGLHCG
jgi:hypothetical protein